MYGRCSLDSCRRLPCTDSDCPERVSCSWFAKNSVTNGIHLLRDDEFNVHFHLNNLVRSHLFPSQVLAAPICMWRSQCVVRLFQYVSTYIRTQNPMSSSFLHFMASAKAATASLRPYSSHSVEWRASAVVSFDILADGKINKWLICMI